ncbi:MAG: alpha/beta hydrolase [Armatimonadetes bacterium]|nr:alpha/beta hydrolase [Akkermansiaceae bacterium]
MWVVCGGNGTLALEWSRFFTDNGHTNDAYLLVDFPGYGQCEGRPTPKSIRENLKHAISAACSEAGWEEIQTDRLRVFGHSLGAAAVLMAAEDFQIRKGVLLAPFTSSMDMAKVYTGLPLGFLVTERFDNRARIGAVSKFGPGRLVIVHGTEDESIPVRMGRELARLYPDNVIFREVAQGKHNNIQQDFPEEIIKAISESAE